MKTQSLALFLIVICLIKFTAHANLSTKIKSRDQIKDKSVSQGIDSEAILLIKKDLNSEVKVNAGWINPLFKSMGINDLSLQEGVKISQHFNPTYFTQNKKKDELIIKEDKKIKSAITTNQKPVEVNAKITEVEPHKVNKFLNNEVAEYIEFN